MNVTDLVARRRPRPAEGSDVLGRSLYRRRTWAVRTRIGCLFMAMAAAASSSSIATRARGALFRVSHVRAGLMGEGPEDRGDARVRLLLRANSESGPQREMSA